MKSFVHSNALDFQLEIIALLALIFHDLNMLIDYESMLYFRHKKRGPRSTDHGPRTTDPNPIDH